jgi:uncharacterized damage-inducible protein DinB
LPKAITESLAKTALGYAGQLEALIDALPETLWEKKAGAWPAWQHIVHAASCFDFFLPGSPTPPPAGLGQDVVMLNAPGPEAPAKEEVKSYLSKCSEKIKAFASSLDDSKLSEPNGHLESFGIKWNMAETLANLAAHSAYHLGYGDALLRAEGLAGIF